MSKVFRCKCTCKETRQGLLQPVLLQGSAPAASSASQGVLRVWLPLSARLASFASLTESTAISAHAKTAFNAMSTICKTICQIMVPALLLAAAVSASCGVEKSTYKRVDVCHSQISFQDSFQIRFFRQFRRRKNCVRKARTLFECNKKHSQTNCVRSVMPVRSVFGYADAFGRCCRNCPQKTSLQLYCF